MELDWGRRHCDHSGELRAIREFLTDIDRKLETIMTTQDDINAAVAEDNSLLTDLGTQVQAVSAAQAAFATEITSLQGQGVDTSGLVTANAALAAAQAPLDAAVAALTAASAPAAPPAAPSGASN
jgi:hypothetical protein